MKLLAWLDVPAQTFLRGAPTAEADRGQDTLGVITAALRADPAIGRDEAGALEELLRVAYSRLRTEVPTSSSPGGEKPPTIKGQPKRSKGAP